MNNQCLTGKKKEQVHVVTLQNDHVRLDVWPERGGKIVQIFDKKSNISFLKESNVIEDRIRAPKPKASFLPPYAAGFDECFPTVAPCTIEVNGTEVDLPDHGELWTQCWEYSQQDNTVCLKTEGRAINYRFVKKIELLENSIIIKYKLENQSSFSFPYLWSAHPLLQAEEGDKLLLPNEVQEVFLNWATDESMGVFEDRLSWPCLKKNGTIDYSVIQGPELRNAIKVFSNSLTQGRAGLYRKKANRSLIFSFDTERIPFLGIWLCYGGWPESKSRGDYTVALEPCSGRPDALADAIKRGDHKTIASHEIQKWELQISIIDGK